MPTILETIREYDEDILIMIAESWGIELEFDTKKKPAEQIAEFISQIQINEGVISIPYLRDPQSIKSFGKRKRGDSLGPVHP